MSAMPTPEALDDAIYRLDAARRVLCAIARDAEQAQPRLSREDHEWANALIAQTREQLRPVLPDAIATVMAVARLSPDGLPSGLTPELWRAARSTLAHGVLAAARECQDAGAAPWVSAPPSPEHAGVDWLEQVFAWCFHHFGGFCFDESELDAIFTRAKADSRAA